MDPFVFGEFEADLCRHDRKYLSQLPENKNKTKEKVDKNIESLKQEIKTKNEN